MSNSRVDIGGVRAASLQRTPVDAVVGVLLDAYLVIRLIFKHLNQISHNGRARVCDYERNQVHVLTNGQTISLTNQSACTR